MTVQPELTAALERCSTAAIHDTLREMGLGCRPLPATIRPLDPGWRLAGPVQTVSGHRDEALGRDETLLAWTELLSLARRGHVLVCQPNDSMLAHMGELSAEALQLRGVRGYLVDGGCRDTDFVLRIGFPTWCRYTTPADIVGRWKPDAVDDTVRIGETDVRAGDYLLADRDGTVVVPADVAGEVIERALRLVGTEDLVRDAIRRGTDPKAAYLEHGVF